MIIIIQKIYIKVNKNKDLFLFLEYNFRNLAIMFIFKIKSIRGWIFIRANNDNITFLGDVGSNWLAL